MLKPLVFDFSSPATNVVFQRSHAKGEKLDLLEGAQVHVTGMLMILAWLLLMQRSIPPCRRFCWRVRASYSKCDPKHTTAYSRQLLMLH